MTCIELLELSIAQLERDNGKLIVEKAKLAAKIQQLERALRGHTKPPWPELPNGEGIAPRGLTESEILQGREPPPGCDPKGRERLAPGLIDVVTTLAHLAAYHASRVEQGREPPPGCDPVDPGEGSGYHPGSSEDPRD